MKRNCWYCKVPRIRQHRLCAPAVNSLTAVMVCITVCCVSVYAYRYKGQEMKHKVILDCDNTMGMPGRDIDDGLLIMYLLGREDIDLLGITLTFGNAGLKDVSLHTRNLLAMLKREDIPVCEGEIYQEELNPGVAKTALGHNRCSDEMEPLGHPTPAASFLAETVARYPQEVTILAAGPVGNLYDASKVYPEFYQEAKQFVCMGGYTEDLYIDGRKCRELNFSCNPEAAYQLLHGPGNIVIMNGHVCLQAPFFRRDLEKVSFWPQEIIDYIHAWFARGVSLNSIERFFLWDLLPGVYISYPELFADTRVCINPTRENLLEGMLMPCGHEGKEVCMPEHILDRDAFMGILVSAWETHAKQWRKANPELSWEQQQ